MSSVNVMISGNCASDHGGGIYNAAGNYHRATCSHAINTGNNVPCTRIFNAKLVVR